ncbi:TetR/AcrR family transcriptional regulator [Actinomadura rupiterrae]|uniref:TetR/AcrR family transcriptional regulator n=1 Tax=Actinomadura rupiterrae TaxID=559627 RepID=UPI0020A506CA|nr:TetR/AcrR family transcriptional regulator [Actinomadura rupiterrae]MCP2340928.1 AcrR family transcriptional regulator [Actinomadura rupiterrae]
MTTESRPLRADARRNRDRLVAAAAEVFAERGLGAPLEDVARRAGVSIGTLYNRFPTRDDLVDAVFRERLGALDRVAAEALADPDPWNGFVLFVEGLFELQAADLGLNEALASMFPAAAGMEEACGRGMRDLGLVIGRARDAGVLRADFEATDVALLVLGMSRVIGDSLEVAPGAWRRCLGFVLDGLRPEAARPGGVPALTAEELAQVAERGRRRRG